MSEETTGGAKAPRKHNPNWKDRTRKERQQKRREALNQKAQALGYETWSKFETAVINDEIQVSVQPNPA